MLFILSMTLDKNIFDTISIINKFLLSNPNIINNILDGNILNYVSDIKGLVKLLNNTFTNIVDLSNYIVFELWNEFFIDIAKYFGIVFIIIDEEDTETMNDSKLKLLIHNNIKNSSEYIYNNNNYNYILLCRRHIENKVFYYPILKLNYKEYYLDNTKFKIVHSHDDQIILKIKNIVNVSLSNLSNESRLNNINISLEQINNFILFYSKYKIIKYFINKQNYIYSVLIQLNKKEEYLYINVDNKSLSDITHKDLLKSKLYDFSTININKYNLRYKNVLLFIKDMNEHVFNINKSHYSDTFYKVYMNNLIRLNNNNTLTYLDMNETEVYKIVSKSTDKSTDKIVNNKMNQQFKYLRIQSFIIHNNSSVIDNSKAKIIGVTCNNLNIYINDNFQIAQCIKHIDEKYNNVTKLLSYNKIKKKDMEDLLTRELSLEYNNYKFYIPDAVNILNFSDYKNYFKFYQYHPYEINKIINDKNIIEDNRLLKINNAIYETNLYNLLVLHIISILKKIKNISLRNKLKLVISNFTQNDITLIETSKSNKKLYNIIYSYLIEKDNSIDQMNYIQKVYSNLIILFKNVININNNTSIKKLKDVLLNVFDETRFSFDDLYLYDLLKLNKKDFITKINSMLDKILVSKKVNSNQNIIDLTLCNGTKKSYYCDNNKLIIDRNIYKTMIDIFYYDITNPFKQKLLLNFININSDIYKFNNYLNEKIFIYY